MIYKIYPFVHWSVKLVGFFVSLYLLSVYRTLWIVPASWLIAALLAVTADQILLSLYPRARYVNSEEVDGMGYVHSNADWLIQWLLILMVTVVVAALAKRFM